MPCCTGKRAVNDNFSNFSDACYTGNIPKMTELLLKHKTPDQLVNEKDKEGVAPIHKAAENGCDKTIQFLIKHKANVDAVTETGETPIHIASFYGKKTALEKLLKKSKPTTIDKQEYQHGHTALHIAVSRGYPEIVRMLLDAGANPDLPDKNGQTAKKTTEFWSAQEEAGMKFIRSQHSTTRDVLLKRLNSGGSTVSGSPTRAETPDEDESPDH